MATVRKLRTGGVVLKKTVAVLALVVACVLVYASTLPDSFRVRRGATIHAVRADVFDLVNDFHAWPRWSPWAKLDPAMQVTYSGSAAGRGAVYEWSGNRDVGRGRIEITESTTPSRVVMQLDFLEPFETRNLTEFTFETSGDSTLVTWTMRGPTPLLSKVMQVFVDFDAMIGKDFEQGLANLQVAAEKGAGK